MKFKAPTCNRNSIFTLLLLIIFVAIGIRILPPSVEENFVLVVTKNKEKVRRLNQKREIKYTKTYKIDKINLAENNRFKHPVLGDLGYKEDYFTDITGNFHVYKAGKYKFRVESDDGFKLYMNSLQVCEYQGSRPLGPTLCSAHLKEGHNHFKLTHYQGFGHVGLRMKYADESGSKYRLWGDDSEFIRFGD